jgi:hypothetical protein
VGIGSTAPGTTLVVNGGETSAFFTRSGASAGDHNIMMNTDEVVNNRNQILFNAVTSQTTGGIGQSSATTYGSVTGKITQAHSSTLKGEISLYVNTGDTTTEAVTVTDAANLEILAGNLVIGTAGKGIDFEDTGGNSQLLDDYEEGEYDAAITCAAGSITINTDYNRLSYTKIGRLVHIQGSLTVGAESSAGGATTMNLPFTASNTTESSGISTGFSWIYLNGSAITNGTFPLYMNMTEGGATVRLFFVDAGTSSTENIGDDHTAANSVIYVNMSYEVPT